jgi:hypothetical protein
MKLLVTKEDVDLAVWEYPSKNRVAICCPVYQCLKRNGIRVGLVGIEGFYAFDVGESHSDNPQIKLVGTINITTLRPTEWPKLKAPIEIEILVQE